VEDERKVYGNLPADARGIYDLFISCWCTLCISRDIEVPYAQEDPDHVAAVEQLLKDFRAYLARVQSIVDTSPDGPEYVEQITSAHQRELIERCQLRSSRGRPRC